MDNGSSLFDLSGWDEAKTVYGPTFVSHLYMWKTKKGVIKAIRTKSYKEKVPAIVSLVFRVRIFFLKLFTPKQFND
jgi:hypothetical protein